LFQHTLDEAPGHQCKRAPDLRNEAPWAIARGARAPARPPLPATVAPAPPPPHTFASRDTLSATAARSKMDSLRPRVQRPRPRRWPAEM